MHYTFSNTSVSGFDVADLATGSAVFNSRLQNGAVVLNNQLLLSASLSQHLTLDAFTTGQRGLTFSCWFRSSNSGTPARVFDFGNGPSADNIIVEVSNNDLQVVLYVGGQVKSMNTNVNINNNVLYHAAWVLSTSGTWIVYLNGMIVAQQSSMIYPASTPRWLNYIGKSNWGGDPYFNGAIRDFRVYNYNLSSAEVGLLFNSAEVSMLRKFTS